MRFQLLLESIFKGLWHLVGLACAEQRNRLTNIVNNDLARVAASEMLRKLFANLS